MSNTEIHPAGSYHSKEFEYVNDQLREHFQLANKEIDKVKEHVNELVVIVHNDNKDWSIKKICEYIAGRNDDFEELGFSTRTIIRYLNEENRQLVDTRKQKRQKGDTAATSKPSEALEDFRQEKGRTMLDNNIMEPDDDNGCHHNALEDSSSSSKKSLDEMLANPILPPPSEGYPFAETESEDEEVIIYDPVYVKSLEKQNKELMEKVEYWKQKYEELKQKYEQVIPPYEIPELKEINGQEYPQIIHSDPYKRTAWTEVDQKQVKKMGFNKK